MLAACAWPIPNTSSDRTETLRQLIRLAKRMIVDGRMPTPEEARRQLQQRRLRENRKPKTASQKASVPESKNKQPDYLGEPWVPLKDRAVIIDDD